MTQTALAKAAGVSQAAIAQIEMGAFLASDELLQQIAKRTNQPIQFFTQEPPPEFPVGSLLFRSHASMTKRELAATYRNAQVGYEVYVRLRSRLRPIPVAIPQLPDAAPSSAARETKKALGIAPLEPIPHLLNLLEWSGVIAIVVPDVKSSDAFSLWYDSFPVIALSAGRPGDRARMSVSHELAHLVLHRGKNRFEVDDLDADEFAAEFLMPERAMLREIKTPVTLSSLAELKPRWRVSIQALIRRAKDIGTVTDRQYRYLFEQVSAMGWRTKEPVEIEPEQPRALRQMAEMIYGDPVDHRAMAHEMALEADALRSLIGHFAPKSERSMPGWNVVTLPKRRA
jgi:Zn-dependent peptidase ImmA (M78 family)